MCVIVYKPAGVEFPDEKLLMNCFERNSDGAGYMYAHKGKVYIRKGLMTFKGFMDSLDDLDPRVDRKKTPFVFHFRISTQAGVRKDCCHPYPLSKNMDDLRKLKTEAEFGVAHNGIISLTSEYSYKGVTPTYNDTMKFIADYLSLIILDRHYYKNRDTITLIKRLAGSKLAILDGNGHCELIGKFTKHEGCWYSNNSYEGIMARYASYRPYGGSLYSDYYGFSYAKPKTKDSKTKTTTKTEVHKWFDKEEAEYYFDEDRGIYWFDDYNCPMILDDDPTYCRYCANRIYCEMEDPVSVYDEQPTKARKTKKADA